VISGQLSEESAYFVMGVGQSLLDHRTLQQQVLLEMSQRRGFANKSIGLVQETKNTDAHQISPRLDHCTVM
jgi:hypothetical protein